MSELDTICYNKNFLTRVIFRIDFESILKLGAETPTNFQEKIRSRLPKFRQVAGHELNFDLSSPAPKTSHRQLSQWIFSDEGNTTDVSLTQNLFAVSTKAYKQYDEFRGLVNELYTSFLSIYSPIAITRIGLRFINEFHLNEGNPFDWKDYFTKRITDQLESISVDKSALSRFIVQATLSLGNGKLRFTYGLPNPEFPARIARRTFLLDYDYYVERPGEISVIETLDAYHHEIQGMFEGSIGDKMRELMGVKKNG